MSFKIIQEFRKPGFIIIPEGLETNGVFWYPPLSWNTKKRHNLLRNKFYLPDKLLWEARPCVVKKSRIATYELAEEQEELLLDCNNSKTSKAKQDIIILRSDESSEEECLQDRTPSKTTSPPSLQSTSELSRTPKSIPQSIDYLNPTAEDVKLPLATINDELWNCFQKTSTASNFRCRVEAMRNSASSPTTIITENPATNNCEASQPNIEAVNKIDKDISLDCDSESDSVGIGIGIGCHLTKKSNNNNSQSSNILSRILKNQQHHQEEISKQLIELKTYIQDGLSTIFIQLETLTQIQYSNSLSSVNPEIYPKKFCIENFKKVSTCEEANGLEKMLMISEFKADMVVKMSNIIGSNGKRIGKGWDCCYDLIETVFQRKFLKICSWTGASTSQMEDAKIAFLKYKNIISCFASVILNADPEFSFERTKEFFKEVLRTSSIFLNHPNRDRIREQSPNKTTENDAQHQSRKSIKRKRLEDEEQNEPSRKEKSVRNKGFERRIDQILVAANRVLDSARELNMDANEGDDEDDTDDYNGDGCEDDPKNNNKDENVDDNEGDNETENDEDIEADNEDEDDNEDQVDRDDETRALIENE